MKTTKLFFMAALALTFAACSNDDNDFENPAQQPAEAQGIPFTATISMGGDKATTRALSENGSGLTATWTVDEEVALIHNGIIDKVTVASVDGNVATISGTITSDADGAAVTVIFPYSAVDLDTKDVKADLLYAQSGGTLDDVAAKYDVRKGNGTLKVSGTASLNDDVTLTNQFAIFKFTTKNSDASDYISVTSLTVSTGGQNYVITPASATSELYVALPAVSGQAVTFTATDGSNLYTCYKDGVTFAAGNYYQSTLKNSNMVECGCDNLMGICYSSDEFTGQVLSAAQAIALAQAKAAETGSNCAVFYDHGDGYNEIKFAKNDGTTGSARANRNPDAKGLSGYKGYYVSK